MLVLGLEVLEELIETLIFLSHFSDALIQRFTLLSLVRFHERLQFLNFLDSPRPSQIALLAPLLLLVLEEQHLVLLVLVLGRVLDHLLVHTFVV